MRSPHSYFGCSLLLVLLAFISPVSQAQERGCEKLNSTAEKAECLEQELRLAEAEMKATLRQAISVHQDSRNVKGDSPTAAKFINSEERLTVDALRKSQAKWLEYRESACSAVEHKYEGGTITSEAVPACKLELTEQRMKWLKGFIGDSGEK